MIVPHSALNVQNTAFLQMGSKNSVLSRNCSGKDIKNFLEFSFLTGKRQDGKVSTATKLISAGIELNTWEENSIHLKTINPCCKELENCKPSFHSQFYVKSLAETKIQVRTCCLMVFLIYSVRAKYKNNFNRVCGNCRYKRRLTELKHLKTKRRSIKS